MRCVHVPEVGFHFVFVIFPGLWFDVGELHVLRFRSLVVHVEGQLVRFLPELKNPNEYEFQ